MTEASLAAPFHCLPRLAAVYAVRNYCPHLRSQVTAHAHDERVWVWQLFLLPIKPVATELPPALALLRRHQHYQGHCTPPRVTRVARQRRAALPCGVVLERPAPLWSLHCLVTLRLCQRRYLRASRSSAVLLSPWDDNGWDSAPARDTAHALCDRDTSTSTCTVWCCA